MALTKKGTLKFGIGTDGLTIGTMITNVTSAEHTTEATTNVTAKNTDGEIVAQVVGNNKISLKADGYGDAPPAVGEDLTVHGSTGTVIRSGVSASNEDFVKFSVEAEAYPTIPAPVGP